MRVEPAEGPADTWDAILLAWRNGRSNAFLRAYSDAVNRALLERWLPRTHARRVLKTDLFDEAVGDGLLAFLRERVEEVVGIDVSPAVVDAAQARSEGVKALKADTRNLPFADGSFDVVVSNSTLDHFERHGDIEIALDELRRVLEPGGRLLITLDNGSNPLVLLRNAVPTWQLRGLGLVPYPVGVTFGPRGLRKALARAGFEIEATRALMHCPRVIARAAAAIGFAGPERLLHAVLSCERLAALPTRHLTAQFVGALARRRV